MLWLNTGAACVFSRYVTVALPPPPPPPAPRQPRAVQILAAGSCDSTARKPKLRWARTPPIKLSNGLVTRVEQTSQALRRLVMAQ